MPSLASWENAQFLLQNPEYIGHDIGFKDLTSLHGLWIREIVFGSNDYTLQAHRGAYKSSALAVAFALIMILYPRRNIIFIRKTDTDVMEMLRMVGKILHSQILIDLVAILYGVRLELVVETTDRISTNLWHSPMGAPQMRGLGVKSSITGSHSWYVVTDDICNIMDRISRAERDRTKIAYDELQNIRNRGGRIINLGTPWHKDDVFSKMPNIHRYDCYHTGLISKEKLLDLRQSMSNSLFAANYELKHIAAEDALFKDSPQFFDDEQKLRDGFSHVDAAYGGADYTAFTCGRLRDDVLYLYGRLWRRHVEDVIDDCIMEADRLMCWPMYCEDNGDKGFVFNEIRKRNCYSKRYTEDQNKYVKISTYLKKWYPRIRFLEGTDPEYIDQIMEYTEDAEHDDAPDSAACICRLIEKRYHRSII